MKNGEELTAINLGLRGRKVMIYLDQAANLLRLQIGILAEPSFKAPLQFVFAMSRNEQTRMPTSFDFEF